MTSGKSIRAASPSGDIAALMALATELARAAGRLIRDQRPDQLAVAKTKTSATDVVTEMDGRSETLLRQLLARRRPGDAILGEEGGLSAGTTGLTWVVDPIDGTVNYLYGLPEYAVSVAVVAGPPDPATWEVLAGCVYGPVLDVAWWAGAGLGAFRDGLPISVNRPVEPALSLVATGFGYDAGRRSRQVAILSQLIGRVRDIRRIGSAALDLCLVADGRIDAFYERGLNPWDLAAGQLIVTEAGGVCRGLGQRPASNDMVVAGPASTAQWLAEVLESLDADAPE